MSKLAKHSKKGRLFRRRLPAFLYAKLQSAFLHHRAKVPEDTAYEPYSSELDDRGTSPDRGDMPVSATIDVDTTPSEQISDKTSFIPLLNSLRHFYEHLHHYEQILTEQTQVPDANTTELVLADEKRNLLQTLSTQLTETTISTILEDINSYIGNPSELSLDAIFDYLRIVESFQFIDQLSIYRYLFVKSHIPTLPEIYSPAYWQSILEDCRALSELSVDMKKEFEDSIIGLSSAEHQVQFASTLLQTIQDIKNNSSISDIIAIIETISQSDVIQLLNLQYQKLLATLQNKEKATKTEIIRPENQENAEIKLAHEEIRNQLSKLLELKHKFAADQIDQHLEKLLGSLKIYQKTINDLMSQITANACKFDERKQKELHHDFMKSKFLHLKIMQSFGATLSTLYQCVYAGEDEPSLLLDIIPQGLKSVAPFADSLLQLQNQFKQLTVSGDATIGFLHQIQSGTLFSEVPSDVNFRSYDILCLGLLADTNIQSLLQASIEGIQQCTHIGHINLGLQFVKVVVSNDTLNECISFKGEDSIVTVSLLELFEQLEAIPEIDNTCLDDIRALVKQKKQIRQKQHETFLASLQKNSAHPTSTDKLSRLIYTQANKLQHIFDTQEVVDETLEWIQACHPVYFSLNDMDLSNPYQALLIFARHLKNLNMNSEPVLTAVKNKRESYKDDIPAPRETASVASISEFKSVFTQFEQVASNSITTEETAAFAHMLVNTIQAYYDLGLRNTNLAEFYAFARQIDAENLEKGIYTYPESASLNRVQVFTKKFFMFLSTIVLYRFDGNKFIPRENVIESKRLAAFYQQCLNIAYTTKCYSAFSDFYYGIGQYFIPRFIEPGDTRKQFDHLFRANRKKLDELLESEETTPFLDRFLIQYTKLQSDLYLTELIKFIYIGEEFYHFKKFLERPMRVDTTLNIDIERLMDTCLFECFAEHCHISPISLTIQGNQTEIRDALESLADDIKPSIVTKPASIESFQSIYHLGQYLTKMNNREWGYHLSNKPERELIMNFVLSEISYSIQRKSQIPSLYDVTNILTIIDNLERNAGTPISRERLYAKIFDAYTRAFENMPETIDRNAILAFQKELESNPIFNNILDNPPKWYDFFSPRQTCYDNAIALEDITADKLELSRPETEETETSAFIDLLHIVLEGKAPAIFAGSGRESSSNFAAMMSSREYWITEWDPENVGASQIFLSLSEEKQSALHRFSAESLKEQFLGAFHWALKIENSNNLLSAQGLETPNLLLTTPPLAKDTQLIVIQYLLLSFDILGKIAGKDGALVLKNYDAIDAIITNIERLQSYLSSDYCYSNEFKRQIEAQIQSLQNQNQQIADMLEQRRGFFDQNQPISLFCHLNERLVYILLGLPFKESILSPKDPPIQLQKIFSRIPQSITSIDADTMTIQPVLSRPKLEQSVQTKNTKTK